MSMKSRIVVAAGNGLSTATCEAASVGTETDCAIVSCLIDVWTKQGLTVEHATAAAINGLEKLKRNAGTETWCLAPEADDSGPRLDTHSPGEAQIEFA
jgi:threonine synthase